MCNYFGKKERKKKMKRIISVVMSAVLALGGAGCSYMSPDAEYPVKIAGYTFDEKPESIVCLDDSVADILIACGYAELIKARSDECTQEEIEDIKTVGSEKKPDVNKIISANPDVVFVNKTLSGDVRNKLEEANINVLTMVKAKNNEDLSVLYESICAVAGGDKSGRKKGSEKANSVVTTMGDLQRIIPESEFLMTACYLYDTEGDVVYDDTFGANLFKYANAVNICGHEDGDVIQKITLSDPKYIFCDTGVKEQLEKDDIFKNLSAVKEGNVTEIPKNIFERQGNSITQVLSEMIEIMYPALSGGNSEEPSEKAESSEESSATEESSEESSEIEESSEESSEIEESSEESSEIEESSEESSEIEESSEESSAIEESSEESSEIEESSEESSEIEESSEESSETSVIVVVADDSLNITQGMRYRVGEEDNNVKIIQQRLKDLGYFKGEVTGYYGEKTAKAVSDYEVTNRIDPDGNLSTPELYLLFSNEVLPASN